MHVVNYYANIINCQFSQFCQTNEYARNTLHTNMYIKASSDVKVSTFLGEKRGVGDKAVNHEMVSKLEKYVLN